MVLTHTRDPGLERPASSTAFLDQCSPPASLPGIDTEMSDQKVIYSTLRFLQSPSESQNRIRPGRTQRPGKTDDKVFSALASHCSDSWDPLFTTIGDSCSVGDKDYIQENDQQRENIRNLSQEYQIVQNDSYFKEQLLTNKILECNSRENESLQQKMKQDFIERTCQRKNIGKLYESHWSCCGIKCYYFIPEYKNWKGCKQTCQSYNSFLLKINDQDELRDLQPSFKPKLIGITTGLDYHIMEEKENGNGLTVTHFWGCTMHS
ncbi:killer cell lectin-like receptor subfamily A pseudogene 1 [Prionailurus iriomotensis]